MKFKTHCFLSVAALSVMSLNAGAQTPVLAQDFEGPEFPTAGWSVLDNDGDGKSWLQMSGSQHVTQYSGSKKLAISLTRDPSTFSSYQAQDNWLITPPVNVTNDKFIVQFVYAAQDLNNTEPLSLLVSESGTEPTDFVEIWSTTADNGYDDDIAWSQAKRSLAAYQGKTIRVAIRHRASSTYGLSVDNFFILNQAGPATPTGFTLNAATDGKKEITLSWTNPSKNGIGDDISDLSIMVYRDGEFLTELTGRTPGETDSYIDTTEDGTHTYAIAAKTAEGESLKTSTKSIYLGEDIPKPVSDPVALTLPDGTVSLSWTAPSKGVNNGYLNFDAITYTVYRDNNELVHGIKECSYVDPTPAEGNNAYTVTAVSGAGESAIDAHASAYVSSPSVVDVQVSQTAERDNGLERLPINVYTNYSVSQSIYTPKDFNFVTGSISDLVYKTYRGMDAEFTVTGRVYITSTTLGELKDWAPVTEADKVFEGDFILKQGTNDLVLHLTTPFNYTGGNIVVTMIKDNRGNASYTDRFYSVKTAEANRSFTTSTYSQVDISQLPSSYSNKALAERPSTRFIVTPSGMASLSGKVTSGADATPVSDVTVAAAGYEGLTAVTDREGNYSFRHIPAAVTSLTFSKTGYENAQVNVTLADGATATADASLTRLPNFTLSGKVTTGDTGLNAENGVVVLGGYESREATIGPDGRWSIPGVYSGHDYTIAIRYPLYEVYDGEFNFEEASDREYQTVVLDRALIPAWNLNAAVSPDGSAASLTWNDPTSRDCEPGMKSIGDVATQRYTGGDYYSTNFNIAHAYSEKDLADQKMVGLSVTGERIFVKKSEGAVFYAKVWRGTKENPVEVASQPIPVDDLPEAGDWVTITFDNPAEIKPGSPYMIGAAVNGGGSSSFGQATGSSISGGNNVKWSENPYTSDGYSPWCIQALCKVPGTEVTITANPDAPRCAYNVYRGVKDAEGSTTWSLLTTTPVSDLSYTDNAWSSQLAGEYVYGVSAIYNKAGESGKALSEPISRSVDTDVALTAFISPVKSVERQQTATVKVAIANFGELPVESVPVTLTLNGQQSVSATHTETLQKGESAEITLGEIDLADGLNILVATAAAEGDEVSANNALTFELPNFENINLRGYRWDAYGNAGFMEFGSNNPEAASFKMEVTPNDALVIAGEAVNGTFYGYTATWWGESREFVEIDPSSWIVSRSVENTDDYVLDMAYDYSTDRMFCLATAGEIVNLGTVNLATGAVEPIGVLSQVMRTLACDLEGKLYAIDNEGKYYSVDPATAETSLLGETGVPQVTYLQSMAFDHNTGRLFWTHTNNAVSGDVYELSPADGEATRLGTVKFQGVDPSEIVGLHTAYTAPVKSFAALSTDPADGEELSEFSGVTITFPFEVTSDAAVLAGATFTAPVAAWNVVGNGTTEVRILPCDESNIPFTVSFEPDATYTLVIPQGAFLKANGDYSEAITIRILSNVTGLEGVHGDSTMPVRYFNLQGSEVAAPVAGNVYIIVHSDGSVTKELIR